MDPRNKELLYMAQETKSQRNPSENQNHSDVYSAHNGVFRFYFLNLFIILICTIRVSFSSTRRLQPRYQGAKAKTYDIMCENRAHAEMEKKRAKAKKLEALKLEAEREAAALFGEEVPGY